MIARERHREALRQLLANNPVVALVGGPAKSARPRWPETSPSGGPAQPRFFDLESSADRARLADPLLALAPLRGLVALDEIQRMPDVFAARQRGRDPRRGADTFPLARRIRAVAARMLDDV